MPYRDSFDQDENGTRVCKDCSARKPMEDFPKTNKGRHRRRKCKICVESRRQELHEKNPEVRQKRARNYLLRKKYGLTEDDFFVLIRRQNRMCGACPEILNMDNSVVDHDHSTGKVRGLLCRRCNLALGLLRDDPVNVWLLYLYIRSNKSPRMINDLIGPANELLSMVKPEAERPFRTDVDT